MQKSYETEVKPEDAVIIIGRQYGSGGRAVGKLLAEKLHIPYYDRELLIEASKKFGIDTEILRFTDERRPGIIRSIFSAFYGNTNYDYTQPSVSHEKLYEVQSSVIQNIAKQSGCIIVGRTADYVLRNHPGLISVFIHADVKKRAERVLENSEAPTLDKAEILCRKKDKERSEFYNYFTGKIWGAAENYDLTIDSTNIDFDTITELIIEYISKKNLS